jgi:DNA-binding IclR family transcriptional regulator
MVSGIGVLDKAMVVLSHLERQPLGLGALVESTGLPRATVHRLASALVVHGLVRRDDEGRYALGLRLVGLGRAATLSVPLAETARPALEALRDATGESVQLYVRDGDHRVCVVSLESPHGLRTIVPLGAVLPIEAGSAGSVLRGDPAALDRGWVESVGEREAGVASVSAPVLDAAGRVRAAVSVSGPIERTTRRPGHRYAAAVRRAAAEVASAAFRA